jgi:lysophospholipase
MLFALVVVSFNAFAISETNYKSEYQEKIIPVINAFQIGSFEGLKNISIHYATYTTNPSATRCLVILPGRSEALEKYAEVVYDLDTGTLAGEFQYFLMDHRGQGSSGRMLEDTEKGHVDAFNNYVLDLKKFMDTVVKDRNCSETLLLAHSLGAGISTKFLQKYPEYFDRAALSSPMLKIQTAPYRYEVARALVVAAMLAGQGKKYGPGQKPFDPTRNFEANTFTTSPVRYEMAMDIFDVFPATKLGGVTNQWLNEVMYATAAIRAHYNAIKIPLKIFHAGIESYSDKNEMIRLCDQAPHCTRTYLETAKHEVMMDRDVNRDVVISELEKFLK